MTHARAAMMMAIAAAFMVLAVAPLTMAAQATREDLKRRFAQRDAQIDRLKSNGKIGETWEGYVERVDDAEVTRRELELIEEENDDRRRLYQLIAEDVKDERDRVSPEEVGRRNAWRNFMTAKPAEFLKIRAGFWIKRSEINGLKREGKVGEAWQGYVDVVNDARLTERQQALLEAENSIRRHIYQRLAKERDSTLEREAQRMGRQNIEQARRGEYIKPKDGDWQRVR